MSSLIYRLMGLVMRDGTIKPWVMPLVLTLEGLFLSAWVYVLAHFIRKYW